MKAQVIKAPARFSFLGISYVALNLSLIVLPLTYGQEVQDSVQQGWVPKARVSAQGSLASSESVIGQTDGTSQTYGLGFKSTLSYFMDVHEWRNALDYTGNTTRTPGLPRFVKSADELVFRTTYLFTFRGRPSLGAYAKGEIQTSLFKGEDHRAEQQTYRIAYRSGLTKEVQGTTLRLTDPFRPMTFKESAGLFWRPVKNSSLKIEARLGLAAIQLQANDQLNIEGVDSSGRVLVNELRDFDQLGSELAGTLEANLREGVTLNMGLELMTPWVNSPDTSDKNALSLTNVDGFAKLSSKIVDWASFGYEYKVKIQPQLLDRAQVQHFVLLSVDYELL